MKRTHLIVWLLCSVLCHSQEKLHVGAGGEYHVAIPEGWAVSKLSNGNVFSYSPPVESKGKVQCDFSLTIEKVPKSLATKSLKTFSESSSQSYLLPSTANQHVTMNRFNEINNKTWWEFETEQKGNYQSRTWNLMTVHNGKSYRMSFSGGDADYASYKQAASHAMSTFLFFSADNTVYTDDPAYKSAETLIAQAKPFAGTYTCVQKEDGVQIFYTVMVDQATDATYHATEERLIKYSDGTNLRFAAYLKPKSVSSNEIILMTDRIVGATPDLPWSKAHYSIRKEGNGFKGQFYSSSKSFEAVPIVWIRDGKANADGPGKGLGTNPGDLGTTTSGSNALGTSNESGIGTSEPANGSMAESALPNSSLGTRLSCGTDIGDAFNEASNIRSCGEGKVVRKGNQLRITAGGKAVTFTNQDEEEDGVGFAFVGQFKELNSFVVSQMGFESGNYVLVNRSSGQKVNFPNTSYTLSPAKKFVVVYSNDIAIQLEESFIAVYSVSLTGLKQVYRKITLDQATSTGWGAGSVRWINDNALEVDKMIVDDMAAETQKSAGKTYIVNQGGKWVMTDKAPR